MVQVKVQRLQPLVWRDNLHQYKTFKKEILKVIPRKKRLHMLKDIFLQRILCLLIPFVRNRMTLLKFYINQWAKLPVSAGQTNLRGLADSQIISTFSSSLDGVIISRTMNRLPNIQSQAHQIISINTIDTIIDKRGWRCCRTWWGKKAKVYWWDQYYYILQKKVPTVTNTCTYKAQSNNSLRYMQEFFIFFIFFIMASLPWTICRTWESV